MPPLKTSSPLSLEKLCFLEIVNHMKREIQLCNYVKRFENSSLLLRTRGLDSAHLLSDLACYLDKLPPLLNEIVRQDITNLLLSKTQPQASDERHIGKPWFLERHIREPWFLERKQDVQNAVALQMLEIVLNKDIKVIDFVDGKKFFATRDSCIWTLISQCTGLQRLGLNWRNSLHSIGNDGPSEIRDFLTPFIGRVTLNCSSLTELVLKDNVTHWDVLQLIGKNCKHLTHLDLSGSRISCSDVLRLCVEPVSDEGGSGATRQDPWKLRHNLPPPGTLTPLCRTLRELILSNTNVRARGAGLLLQLIPTLTSLGDLVYMAAGLKNIYGLIKAKKCKTLRLKHAFYRGPSNVKLKILANCCPLLESLVLGSKTDRRIVCNLHLNSLSFKMLTNLTLENIHSEDIALALQHVPNLLILKIDCVGLDISAVSRYCPRLRRLHCVKEPIRDMAHLGSTPTQSRFFTQLEHVTFATSVSLVVAHLVFRYARELRTVDVTRVRDVGDEIFLSWLESNPFLHLESFVIRFAGFTPRTVDRLLDSCPKLTVLGELGGWDIRSWECRRIKDAVSLRGFDLDLRIYNTRVNDIHDILDGNASTSDDTDSNPTDVEMSYQELGLLMFGDEWVP